MKTWFITGASRGFGLRIAKLALEQGDNIVATARRAETVIEALGQRERLLGFAAAPTWSSAAGEPTPPPLPTTTSLRRARPRGPRSTLST